MSNTEHEDMARDTGAMMRAGMQAALLLGEHFARSQASASRRAAKQKDRAAKDTQTRLRAERAAAEAHLRLVTTDAWWRTADRGQIADAWCTAVAWRNISPVAATAAENLRTRIQQQYSFDPESHTFSGSALAQRVPEMEDALSHAAWRRYRTRQTNEAVLDQVALQQIRDDLDRSALTAFVALHDQATAHIARLDQGLEQETKRLEAEGVQRDGGVWLTTEQHRLRQTRIAVLEGRDAATLKGDADQAPHRDRWTVDVGVTLSAEEFKRTTDLLIELERRDQQPQRQEQDAALLAAENAIKGLGDIGRDWMREYDLSPDRAYASALVAPDRDSRDKMWGVGSRLAAAEGELALLIEAGQTGTAEAVAAAAKVETLEAEMAALGDAGERWVSARKVSTTHAGEIDDRSLAWILQNPVVEQDALAALLRELNGEPAPADDEADPAPAAAEGKQAGKTKQARPKTDFDKAREWARRADTDWYHGWETGYMNADTADGRRLDEAALVSKWRLAGQEFRKAQLGDLTIGIVPDEVRFSDEWAEAEKTYRTLIRAGADPRALVQAAQGMDLNGVDDPVQLTIRTLRDAAGEAAQTPPPPPPEKKKAAPQRRERKEQPPKVEYEDAELTAARAYFKVHDPEQLRVWNWKLSNMSNDYGRDSVYDEMVLRHRTEIRDTPEHRRALSDQLDADAADAEAKAARLLADLAQAKPAAWATTPPKSTPQTGKDSDMGFAEREQEVGGR